MLRCLIIASVFWFNPLVSNIDILPDLVGYLLVLKAFSKSSYVYDYASELCSSAKKMCIISGVKIFTITMVSSLDLTMSLLLSFTFGVIEVIFGIPFFVKLFETLMYVVPVENDDAHARENKIKVFTIVSFISRLALAILPDLTALSLDGAFTFDTDISYARFRPLFIVVSVVVALVIGVIWLVKFIKFLNISITDEVLEKCNADFLTRTGDNSALLSAKNSIRAVIFTAIGSLFIFDFTWGYTSVDVLQDFCFTFFAMLALAFLFYKKVYKPDRYFIYLACAFAIQIGADVFEMVVNVKYFEKYNLQSMNTVSAAERLYTLVVFSAILSVISLTVSTVLILMIMKRSAKEKIIANSKLFSEIDIDYYLKEFDKRTAKNLKVVIATSLLCSVVYVLSVAFKPHAEWMTLLNLVFEIAYIISFIVASLYIYDEVYKRIATFA